jgi:hypothetical protein
MPTDTSLQALRDTGPRNRPDFDSSPERYEALRNQIVETPLGTPARQRGPAHRRRLVSVSAAVTAAAALAAVVGSLTLGGASPQSAYAAAHRALAATSAERSGTTALTVNGTTLYTMRWNGTRIALKNGQSSPLVLGDVLGPDLQMRLIGGGVYVQGPDGTWTHYASEADVGQKLGPEVAHLHANIHANNAHEILSVASHLHRTPGPDGTTVYRGTVRNAHVDPSMNLSQNEVTGMLAKLRGEGASDSNAPGGTYPDQSKLTLIVGHDGLVKRISFTFQQPSCQPALPNCPASGPATRPGKTITWSVRYSHLGDNRPIIAPATSTSAATQ